MNLFLARQNDEFSAFLEGDEARHCVRSLRLKVGDTVFAVDGDGFYLSGPIKRLDRDLVEFEIVEKLPNWGEHGLEITLLASPLRVTDRFEWLIEKSVELGVTKIIPVISKRTVKQRLRIDRMERILTAALKQCKRSKRPEISEPEPILDVLDEFGSDGAQLIAWCESTQPIRAELEKLNGQSKVSLLIGPEGDFTEEEISFARDKGWVDVTFGEGRLRSETAGVYGLSLIKFMMGF